MLNYLDLMEKVLRLGVDRCGRNGLTRSLFGKRLCFDMRDGFPAVTTKRLAFKSVKAELLWFLSGSRDVNDLNKLGSFIWDANAESDYWKPRARFEGDVGRIYGAQWRSWRALFGLGSFPAVSEREVKAVVELDQIEQLVAGLRTDPYGRRHVVTAWNPGELDQMALPPCHLLFQCYVAPGDDGEQRLSLMFYQRSCDLFLGVPFNIASYALLLHMLAQCVDMVPHELVHVLGDAHIYHAHFEQVREQLTRVPERRPGLWLNSAVEQIDAFEIEDIHLTNYVHHPPIKAEMVV